MRWFTVLILLVASQVDGQQPPSINRDFPLPIVSETKAKSLGIRKVTGRHLILYTDLPPHASIDELPQVFDAAVPQWCAYFRVPEERVSKWKNIGCLVRDKERFVQVGLWPPDLPPFLHGFQRGSQLWCYEQPSDYYRRHLMLHEGTHAFMNAKLGGAGPPWYMEGMAELLGTHRWQDNQLSLGYMPHDRAEVPEWGRIKIVRDDFRAGQPKSLAEIMRYDARAHLHVNPYGWCWAACAFLDGTPQFQRRFREMQRYVDDSSPAFSDRFVDALKDDDIQLVRQWQWFVSQLDYGYDLSREAIAGKPARDFARGEAKIAVAVDRGWQSTGLRLNRGQSYRLTAAGRFQLADKPKIWWCEPNGVTIEYHRGKPLGIVLAAIVDETSRDETTNGMLAPDTIGLGAEITPAYGGTLYLRVNDHPARLADNRGEITVHVQSQ